MMQLTLLISDDVTRKWVVGAVYYRYRGFRAVKDSYKLCGIAIDSTVSKSPIPLR